ncbi:response regulator [Clostridium tagluense]|uniref:response regulator n=1 Tax=Clostridium tagluense TaxID=360422 RepID=UPI001C0AE18E|nr:response regulator [Clostridium tagluense]MBU3127977.1 response regulator [Clostridium tagluense]
MRFFIIDDDQVVRSILSEIIEDFDLGEVVGEAENGSTIDCNLLSYKKVDILIIDLLMPIKDGLNTVKDLGSDFKGKIIMISQVENKEMIGNAYALGVEYYITKPINRLEFIGITQKVVAHMKLQKSIDDIKETLSVLGTGKQLNKTLSTSSEKNILTAGQFLLTELGLISESGSKDILNILEYLFELEKDTPLEQEFPSLKNIFISIATKKNSVSGNQDDIKKEMKASEQRIRRAIFQSLNHLASLGLTDYSNAKFEEYASKYFHFAEVRKKMMELANDDLCMSPTRINIKKFIKTLYIEAKKQVFSNDIY